LGRFLGDEGAATAVEFGILALPFFTLIGAILQTAMIFLASQILDGAVQDSSRLIRTGQAQSTLNYNAASYQAAICSRLFGIFDCGPSSARLLVTVQVVTNFASASAPTSPLDPIDPSKWTISPAYNPGTGSQVVKVTAYYKWPVVVNLPGLNLATSSDGTRLLTAVRVFENEPFT
jgi:Flp pilus assembly protein TadG